ncbi:hypothetical protein AT6N2_C2096 [Agrobacterium tumefaciens]|nr:hypothetical protein AT6N2_C2096 [Agrobacterium tumefaciens]
MVLKFPQKASSVRRLSSTSSAGAEPLFRRFIFYCETVNEIGDWFNGLDGADALSSTPYILPCLGAAGRGFKIHLRGIGLGKIVWIHAGGDDGAFQIVSVYAREIVGINDVLGLRFDDRFLVSVGSTGFLRGDEGGADIGHVSAHGLRRQNGAAIGDRPCQQKRAVEPLTDFLNEREGRKRARMAAGAGRNCDQPVRTLAYGRAGMTIIDHVMQHDATIGMHGGVNLRHGAQGRDNHWHFVFHAQSKIMFQPTIGHVHDLVHRKGRCRAFGIGAIMRVQLLGDHRQPFVKLAFGPSVERRKSADDASLALRQRQLRM